MSFGLLLCATLYGYEDDAVVCDLPPDIDMWLTHGNMSPDDSNDPGNSNIQVDPDDTIAPVDLNEFTETATQANPVSQSKQDAKTDPVLCCCACTSWLTKILKFMWKCQGVSPNLAKH